MQGGIIILNRISNENASNHGIGVLELIDENHGIKGKTDGTIVFAPLKRTKLSGDIVGPLATLCLTQTYSFTKEQCEKVLEARYRFPMPGDAAVTGVKVSFGDVELVTELKDRNQAKQEYKEAKREGKQAAMVTRESPDVFTTCIAGLQPGEDVKVETRYVQMARADSNGWSIRVPLTTAPRFVRKDETSSRYAQGQPLAVLRDPGHRFSMDINLHGASSIESPTHRINIAVQGDNLRIRLQEGEVIPDRDCVLQWKPNMEADRPSLHVMLQDDARAAETYLLAMVSPPASPNVKKVHGEYVLLVDHSGSMEGAKWAAADWAVEKFLRSLDENDYFTIGVFHDRTAWFSKSVLTACESNIDGAIDFLQKNRDSGGTELGIALEQALQISRMSRDISRHLLLITDAEVSDEGRILRLAGEDARRPDRRRISILCIDAAPNSFLALELAGRGGGIARFLTSDPSEGDIATALGSIMETWSRPIYANMRLFCDHTIVAADREVSDIGNGRCYVNLGDMPAGLPVWVSGKIAGNSQDTVAAGYGGLLFCLTTKDGKKIEPLMPDIVTRLEGEAGIKPFFGARKLLGLEFLIHSKYGGTELQDGLRRLGYDPEQVLYKNKTPSLYPENNEVNEIEALRDFIVQESLNYGLPSSETAFIAVYNKAGKRVEATALVPNALPEGWSDEFKSTKISFSGSVSAYSGSRGPGYFAGRSAGSRSRKSACSIIDILRDDDDSVSGLTSGRRPPVNDSCELIEPDSCDDNGGSGPISQSGSPSIAIPAPAQPGQETGNFTGSSRQVVIFDGVPRFTGNSTILFDTAVKGKISDRSCLIHEIRLLYPEGSPAFNTLGRDLAIYLFVEDMLMQRATVRILDTLLNGDIRPLNLVVPAGGQVKIVLADPAGVWVIGAPKLEVIISIK